MSKIAQAENLLPEVSLVFPPLVTTNFGNYYPSTAVLSGYLKANGFGVVQADLNEEFALYLLQPEILEQLATGAFGISETLQPNSMPCVSARLLTRNRDLLFDDLGRHQFQPKAPGPTHLLACIAEVYRTDLDFAELQQPHFYNTPVACFYSKFYEWSGYVENLTRDIHTVGISVPLGPQLVPALILARHIKSQRPDITVVFGGPTLSLMNINDLNQLLICTREIDAVIRFDGEVPLLKLVEQRRNSIWEPTKIPSVSCLSANGVQHNEPGPGPQLNSLPYGDYDKDLLARLSDPEIGIIQARGCYWGKCAYCDYVELYKGSPSYRTRTVDRFIDEMKYQISVHGRNRFAIITESIPPAFALKMSEAILESDLKVSWSSFAMVDQRFTPEISQLMAQSGCDYLEIGVESMTDRVLKLVEKAGTQEKNTHFLKSAAAAGVKLKVNLIPDLPSTTYQEAIESLCAFRALEDCLTYVGVYPFEPTRSSKIGHNPEYYSIQTLESAELAGQSQYPANHLPSKDPAMTDEERQQVHAEFFAFREHINGCRHIDMYQDLMLSDDDGESLLRLADEYLDFTNVADGIQCYHSLTRSLINVPQEWAQLLTIVRAHQPFTRDDLINRFTSLGVDKALYQQLVDFRMLVKC